MKYWFFDGNDVIGPFEPGELAARPGFGVTSLVCPEKFSEDQDSWRLAGAFGDFRALLEKPALSANPPEPATDSFEEEMDTLLKQRNPLGVPPDESAAEDLALEIPKKPAKPGPIEDYFNNIQGEDLGNILGIPDPNENSDMDLARALNTQLGKTNPPADKKVQPLENDPFDEFTSDDSEKETLAEDTLEQPSQPAQTDSSSKPQAAARATQAGAKQTVSKEPDTAGEQAELSKNAEAAPKESVKSDAKKQHTA